ncbi:FAD-dependent monooxygenase [Actinokineospora auranticolor]|uniref:2-polyprenyl-6-methoxyphenol hydroxylase-like FAD-dependent oxidoreductase n=1 Tax=Actinokineospora auranticolor TaxID=155976 RepID=A0A2S6GNR2_9PSEU|nr:FAD-dependent monooxygenase [Actinokineospora auranticolor]PPK66874.1 2-polyprenyl-6-methoxyphenol hydroxylase-like FAD-dependent oxidoreductase [Actinokineospora auranticolor]
MGAVKTALVIGGGIAGPVVGAALRRAGVDVVIHESYDSPADGVGGVVQVAPNGLNALAAVGVADELRGLGQPTRTMVIEDSQGRKVMAFNGLPGLPPSRTLFRSDLYRVLNDNAAAKGVRVEYGKRLVRVEESASAITAVFADGTKATGDILIGADGIRSTVRGLIDPSAPGPEPVGLLGVGGWGPPVEGSGGPDVMHFAQGKRAFFGYWAASDGSGTLWFSNLPDPKALSMAEARAVPTSEWLRRVREAHADDHPAREVLAGARDLEVTGAMEILPTVPHWHRDRMVLVGDAAHAPSPSSGQGVSITVESAVQLARCLRDIDDLETALTTYERLRRPRVEKIIAAARRTNNTKAAGPVARALTAMIMPILTKTVITPRRMFGETHSHTINWDEKLTA